MSPICLSALVLTWWSGSAGMREHLLPFSFLPRRLSILLTSFSPQFSAERKGLMLHVAYFLWDIRTMQWPIRSLHGPLQERWFFCLFVLVWGQTQWWLTVEDSKHFKENMSPILKSQFTFSIPVNIFQWEAFKQGKINSLNFAPHIYHWRPFDLSHWLLCLMLKLTHLWNGRAEK